MKTRTILQKLGSSKLWCAAAGVIAGIYIALGGDADSIQTIAGAVTALASLVSYIITEGKVDAAAVAAAAEKVQDAVETMAK